MKEVTMRRSCIDWAENFDTLLKGSRTDIKRQLGKCRR